VIPWFTKTVGLTPIMRTLEGSRKWVHHSDHKFTMPEKNSNEKKIFSKNPVLLK